MRNPRNIRGRTALIARVRSQGRPCWICGLPIDYSLPARHPLGYELDELVPVSKGGSPVDYGNVAPAHRCCNQWRSDRGVAETERIRDEVRRRFGQWPSALAFCECARSVAKAGKGCKPGTPVRHPKRSSGAL